MLAEKKEELDAFKQELASREEKDKFARQIRRNFNHVVGKFGEFRVKEEKSDEDYEFYREMRKKHK